MNRPCTAIPSRNAVTFSGNSPAFSAQPFHPLRQHLAHGSVKLIDRLVRQSRCQLQRRQPRPVEDLIGIRIPDAAEQPRVRERPLERVVLGSQSLGELFARGVETSRPPRSNATSVASPGPRASTPAASFPLRSGTARRLETRCARVVLASQCFRLALATSSALRRYHQVDHKPEVTLEPDDDPLAHPANLGHAEANQSLDRLVTRSATRKRSRSSCQ